MSVTWQWRFVLLHAPVMWRRHYSSRPASAKSPWVGATEQWLTDWLIDCRVVSLLLWLGDWVIVSARARVHRRCHCLSSPALHWPIDSMNLGVQDWLCTPHQDAGNRCTKHYAGYCKSICSKHLQWTPRLIKKCFNINYFTVKQTPRFSVYSDLIKSVGFTAYRERSWRCWWHRADRPNVVVMFMPHDPSDTTVACHRRILF